MCCFLLLDAAIVLFLALTSATYFAVRKARMQNLPVWSKAGELTLINLLIPLATGAIFCLILYTYNIFILIAPATLLFYALLYSMPANTRWQKCGIWVFVKLFWD
jgi:hypothetical protein